MQKKKKANFAQSQFIKICIRKEVQCQTKLCGYACTKKINNCFSKLSNNKNPLQIQLSEILRKKISNKKTYFLLFL